MDRLPVDFIDPEGRLAFLSLPRPLQARVLELLAQVARRPTLGKLCSYQHATGNLSDCRKLYFDEREDADPRYRIVYRVIPNEEHPRRIEVLRVGLKIFYQDDGLRSIYEDVGHLLGRIDQGR